MITQVQARDKDSGPAGTINYFISGNNHDEIFTLFQINKRTGEITLIKELDREFVDKYVLNIFDNSSTEPRSVMAKL